jgi:hypothetical protein
LASSQSFSRATYAGRQAAYADRVQPELPLRDAEAPQELDVELDHLGVDLGPRRADRLERELVVLAVPPAPGRAVAIHGRDRVRLDGLREAGHPVLDVGPADRRGSLGPEGERAVAPVGERVHLLAHDVRRRARGAGEQARILEAGRLDAPPAVQRGLRLHRVDDVPPQRVARQDVVRPAGGLEPLGH